MERLEELDEGMERENESKDCLRLGLVNKYDSNSGLFEIFYQANGLPFFLYPTVNNLSSFN